MAEKVSYVMCVVALCAFAGCSREEGIVPVEGRVRLDGKPLEHATVEFIPSDGRPSAGKTGEEGCYSLFYAHGKPGALVGTHMVRISTWSEEQVGENEYVTHPETLPAEYNYRSKLTFQVKSGEVNVADFDLVSGGEVVQPPN